MEALAPPLKCLIEVRLGIENGFSVQKSLKLYLRSFSGDFRDQVLAWFVSQERGNAEIFFQSPDLTTHQKVLLKTFSKGLKGEPILGALREIEQEMIEICRGQLERHLRRLPVIGLLPVMLFQVPAFLFLLFGPILLDLLGRIGP